MSSRRHLVSRTRANQDSSPAHRVRQRNAPEGPPVALPPYEPPSFPLTADARREIEGLAHNHDYSKYKKHLDSAVHTIKISAAQINDQLSTRQDIVQRQSEKRRQAGREEEEKTEAEKENEALARRMEKKVDDLTLEAEKALRELIDYGDELAMQETMLQDVHAAVDATPLPKSRASKRRRQRGSDDEDEEGNVSQEEDPTQDIEVLSAVELLKRAKENYAAQHSSKTMRERYDVNDYRDFKRIVHDAQHPGEDAPPVPHIRTWFPEDNAGQGAGSRNRRNNAADNASNSDDTDDDVVIEKATMSLKCPLTYRVFQDPLTSKVCSHTYEKYAVLDYIKSAGQLENGKIKTKCPMPGCNSAFERGELYEDHVILRKLQRAKKRAARDNEDDDDDDTHHRGSKKKEATTIDSDDDTAEIGEDQDQAWNMQRVKREKQQSRGPSMAPSRHAGQDEYDEDVEMIDED